MSPIRSAEPADSDPLVGLLEQLGYSTTAEDIKPRLARLISASDQGVLVAEVDGEVAGVATFQIFEMIYRPEPRCRLTALVVDSNRRRAGVGTELVGAVERIARERGCERVELTTRPERGDALPFYAALGFSERPYRLAKALR